MTQREIMEYLEDLGKGGITPGLGRIRELLRRMGDPQEKLRYVHIAGTNGKGSTLSYLATILHKAGYKVGAYSSPAVFEYRERFRVGGRQISVKDLGRGVELVRQQAEAMVAEGLESPSVFEVETALAFWYFAEKNCDIAVVECGMGGMEDATNVIPAPEVCVLTRIGMDHMGFLGKTLGAIAGQKAGILKPGSRAVTVAQAPEAMEVIRRAAEAAGMVTSEQTEAAELPVLRIADPEKATAVKYGLKKQRFTYGGYKNLEISLAGTWQIENAALAVEAVEALRETGWKIPEKALREGLQQAQWKGRLTILSEKPLLVMDGAHNENAAKQLARSIEIYFTNKRIIYIMGILKDKDVSTIVKTTAPYADCIFTVKTPNNPRAMSSVELAEEVREVNPNVTSTDSVEEALEMARLMAGREDVILAFGSLSFLGKLNQVVEEEKK